MADSNTTTKLIDLDNLSTYHSLMDAKKEEHSIILTQAQYNALTPEEKMNGKTYYISDAGSSGMIITASDVLMTGYSKASSASAITTNDTGSIAFGKLEKGLEDTNSLIPSNATTSNKLATAADIPGVATASTVGLVKPDGTTVTIDANGVLSASADLSNYIEKSATEGLVKNDGTIDTNKYAQTSDLDEYLKLGKDFNPKTWNDGYTNLDGYNIWTDGDNIYYSGANGQYVLDKSTNTWNTKSWSGLTSFDGQNIWTDGENIYYSNNSYQYVLDKSTSTWSEKTWNGYSYVTGKWIWTDGENIYYSNINKQYVLDKSTSTWIEKTWNNLPETAYGNFVWTLGENVYFSGGLYTPANYVLDKSTSTWVSKTWNGYTNIWGDKIWTDGENIYYSDRTMNDQCILDTSTDTWKHVTWNINNLRGNNIWTDGENIYFSDYSLNIGNYVLGKAEYAKKSGTTFIKKTRYTITATNWSNSIDADGYYTYTITLNPTLSLSWPPSTDIAGVNDSTFSTDVEKEAYDLLDECNLTTTSTLILYAKTKPETTFYIWVEGEVAS